MYSMSLLTRVHTAYHWVRISMKYCVRIELTIPVLLINTVVLKAVVLIRILCNAKFLSPHRNKRKRTLKFMYLNWFHLHHHHQFLMPAILLACSETIPEDP